MLGEKLLERKALHIKRRQVTIYLWQTLHRGTLGISKAKAGFLADLKKVPVRLEHDALPSECQHAGMQFTHYWNEYALSHLRGL